jgi:hypothetical protein
MSKNLPKFLAIISTLLILAGCGEPPAPGKYADVAKCLTEKGVIMYGAYWCPHCANQKKVFGGDFQFVKYQECDPKGVGGDKAICVKAGVSSYPTWGFPGQGNLVGEQSVAALADLANCSDKLPAEDLEKLKEAKETANVKEENLTAVGEITTVGTGEAEPVGRETTTTTTTTTSTETK